MATATFERIAHEVEQLTPEEQARLTEYLEDLADIRATDEAKFEGGQNMPFRPHDLGARPRPIVAFTWDASRLGQAGCTRHSPRE